MGDVQPPVKLWMETVKFKTLRQDYEAKRFFDKVTQLTSPSKRRKNPQNATSQPIIQINCRSLSGCGDLLPTAADDRDRLLKRTSFIVFTRGGKIGFFFDPEPLKYETNSTSKLQGRYCQALIVFNSWNKQPGLIQDIRSWYAAKVDIRSNRIGFQIW